VRYRPVRVLKPSSNCRVQQPIPRVERSDGSSDPSVGVVACNRFRPSTQDSACVLCLLANRSTIFSRVRRPYELADAIDEPLKEDGSPCDPSEFGQDVVMRLRIG